MESLAFGGTFSAKNSDGVERKFISLAQCQDYADGCLRGAMTFGQGSLATLVWLMRNDMPAPPPTRKVNELCASPPPAA